jgi:hypothetical protein
MSSATLKPGQSHPFTDHEGGTDLKVTGTAGQPFTTSVNNGSVQTHRSAPAAMCSKSPTARP